MKLDSKIIELAYNALKKSEIVDSKDQYNSVFKGYISSFGASIAQAGLLATIIFYESKSDQAEERPKIIKALKIMLPQKYQIDSLAQYILKQHHEDGWKIEEKNLLKNVTEAMVALKLALRLYKEKDQ